MTKPTKIAFLASDTDVAREALAKLTAAYGNTPLKGAEIIVALGSDGFMRRTLHATQAMDVPVYGMNCCTVGSLLDGSG